MVSLTRWTSSPPLGIGSDRLYKLEITIQDIGKKNSPPNVRMGYFGILFY